MSVRAIEAEVSISSGVSAECTIGREVIVEVHDDDMTLDSLTVTANGTYQPTGDVDGYDRVTVNVPERVPVTESLSVTANGSYTPSEGVDGFSDVIVDVPERIPVTEPLTVIENGTYTPTEGVDGFSSVAVEVPTDGGSQGFKASGNFTLDTSSSSYTLDTGRSDWEYLLIVPRVFPYSATATAARCIGIKLVYRSSGYMISAFGSSSSSNTIVTNASTKQDGVDIGFISINGSVVDFSGASTTAGQFVADCIYDWYVW